MEDIRAKKRKLKEYLENLGSVAVAYSGGVDSTFLLKMAKEVLGERVLAITAKSCLFPEWESGETVDFCREEGIKQIILEEDPFAVEGFANNPPNRCYLCKKNLFEKIKETAGEHGIVHVLEGSNMDDTGDYRPGMKAIAELKVKSPLKDCGLFKEEIRILSKEEGLSTYAKPSFACLASRFVYGETITEDKLRMVEKAEKLLREKGFTQFRVRIHGEGSPLARLELLPEDLERVMQAGLREEIHEKLRSFGFQYVTLDMLGYRTGSMNEVLSVKKN